MITYNVLCIACVSVRFARFSRTAAVIHSRSLFGQSWFLPALLVCLINACFFFSVPLARVRVFSFVQMVFFPRLSTCNYKNDASTCDIKAALTLWTLGYWLPIVILNLSRSLLDSSLQFERLDSILTHLGLIANKLGSRSMVQSVCDTDFRPTTMDMFSTKRNTHDGRAKGQKC